MPTAVAAKLGILKDRPYPTAEDFLKDVKQVLTLEELQQYQNLLVSKATVPPRRGIDDMAIGQLAKSKHWADVTNEEKAFLEKPNPAPDDIAKFKERIECFRLMLWVLGYEETFELPVNEPPDMHDAHIQRACAILLDLGFDRFVRLSRLRWPSDILDETDLTYRLYTAAVQARDVAKVPIPGNLDLPVLHQWYCTLYWLTFNKEKDQDWDTVMSKW